MKNTTVAFAMTLLSAALSGCQTSSQGGGATSDESFRISVPASIEVKQGEVQTVSVSLRRGDQFKRDVTIEARPTKGVNVEPESMTIRASEKPEMQLRIGAPKDAALGTYSVYVKGTPAAGNSTSVEIRVKVAAP